MSSKFAITIREEHAGSTKDETPYQQELVYDTVAENSLDAINKMLASYAGQDIRGLGYYAVQPIKILQVREYVYISHTWMPTCGCNAYE